METGPLLAVVDVGGVGYEVRVPLSTLQQLSGDREVFLFTHLVLREDDVRLYGFGTRAERHLFVQLLAVAGVGPSIGLAALSTLSVDELIVAIEAGDVGSLQRVKGVGKRLAERLSVELKGRLGADALRVPREGRPPPGRAGMERDAVAALITLGFSEKDAKARVESALEGFAEAESIEEIVRHALR